MLCRRGSLARPSGLLHIRNISCSRCSVGSCESKAHDRRSRWRPRKDPGSWRVVTLQMIGISWVFDLSYARARVNSTQGWLKLWQLKATINNIIKVPERLKIKSLPLTISCRANRTLFVQIENKTSETFTFNTLITWPVLNMKETRWGASENYITRWAERSGGNQQVREAFGFISELSMEK